jgi:hypothetical protein
MERLKIKKAMSAFLREPTAASKRQKHPAAAGTKSHLGGSPARTMDASAVRAIAAARKNDRTVLESNPHLNAGSSLMVFVSFAHQVALATC